MILAYVNIDIVADTQMGFDHKQVRKHFGAILDIDVSSSLTVLSNYTQRVLGKFS